MDDFPDRRKSFFARGKYYIERVKEHSKNPEDIKNFIMEEKKRQKEISKQKGKELIKKMKAQHEKQRSEDFYELMGKKYGAEKFCTTGTTNEFKKFDLDNKENYKNETEDRYSKSFSSASATTSPTLDRNLFSVAASPKITSSRNVVYNPHLARIGASKKVTIDNSRRTSSSTAQTRVSSTVSGPLKRFFK